MEGRAQRCRFKSVHCCFGEEESNFGRESKGVSEDSRDSHGLFPGTVSGSRRYPLMRPNVDGTSGDIDIS